MNEKIKMIVRALVLTLCAGMPIVTLAQAKRGFDDPLQGATPEIFIGNIINFILGLIFVLALLALVVGGVRLVASFGDEHAVASAKKIILWAILGLALAIMSWVIITVVAVEILQVT